MVLAGFGPGARANHLGKIGYRSLTEKRFDLSG